MKNLLKNLLYNSPIPKNKRLAVALRYHNLFYKIVKRSKAKNEYIILGLKRSGNHAIINWVMNQIPGLISFCNDLELGKSPISAVQRQTRFNSKISSVFGRKTLIYSYEDYFPSDVFSDTFLAKKDIYVGKSHSAFPVLILRDPYNLFASRLVWDRYLGKLFRESSEYRKQVVALWKAHAREFLGITNYLGPDKVMVNYNSWVSAKIYRKQLADKLNLIFTDQGIDEIPDYGGGRTVKNGKVQERWKLAQEGYLKEIYHDIFDDKELIELSTQIFGNHRSPSIGQTHLK